MLLLGVFLLGALPGSARSGTAQDKLDLNTATFAELRALPGMGDEYVRRVIRFRPYTAKNQLATRGVLPEAEYDRIQDRVIAHRGPQAERKK